MADFINLQAEDVDDGNSSSDNQDDNDAVTSFIDDTNSEENLSDYYCFVNVSRPVGRVEEDAFFWLRCQTTSQRKYWSEKLLFRSDEEVSDKDNFSNSEEKIEEFNKTLEMPHGEENFDSLLYAILYSIQFETTKKFYKCENDKLNSVLLNDLFVSLSKSKMNWLFN